MNRALADILDLLKVERIEENLYRGRNNPGTEHVFGGQVLAQAISAGQRTVTQSTSRQPTAADDRRLHSLHAYFLRPGDWNRPILYQVDRIRDGTSFTTRRVVAIQHGRAIFSMSASWQRAEPGLEHAVPMPDVPPPDSLPSDRETYAVLAASQPEVRRFAQRFEAIDSRQVESITTEVQGTRPARKHTWLRARDRLPDDREVHYCLLAYISDLDFMSTSLLPHGRRPGPGGAIQGASIDHALWLHREFRADEWLLFAKRSPSASGARGFVRGQFFDSRGTLIATAAQECLIRVRRA